MFFRQLATVWNVLEKISVGSKDIYVNYFRKIVRFNKIYSKLSAVLFTCLVNFIFSFQFSKLAVNNSVNNALNFQTKPVLALANQVKALIKTYSGPVKETKVGLIETPISRS